MMIYLFVIIILALVLCCFFHWLSLNVLITFMKEKGYTIPSDDELRKCSLKIIKRFLHIR